jgi:septum formation protein
LLEQAAIPHRVRVSGVDESTIHDRDPRALVQQLAFAKASAVQSCLEPSVDAEITAVLGCDSVFVFEGEVFGKPADAKEAIDRWQRMAGGSGELLTGHCLVADGQGATMACVSTVVQFAALRLGEIEAYVASGEPLNCAGGFALEGRGGLLIRGIKWLLLERDRLKPALVAHCPRGALRWLITVLASIVVGAQMDKPPHHGVDL